MGGEESRTLRTIDALRSSLDVIGGEERSLLTSLLRFLELDLDHDEEAGRGKADVKMPLEERREPLESGLAVELMAA